MKNTKTQKTTVIEVTTVQYPCNSYRHIFYPESRRLYPEGEERQKLVKRARAWAQKLDPPSGNGATEVEIYSKTLTAADYEYGYALNNA